MAIVAITKCILLEFTPTPVLRQHYNIILLFAFAKGVHHGLESCMPSLESQLES